MGNPDIRKASQRKKENKSPWRSFSSVMMLVPGVNKAWFRRGARVSSSAGRGPRFTTCLQGSSGQLWLLDRMGQLGEQSFPSKESRFEGRRSVSWGENYPSPQRDWSVWVTYPPLFLFFFLLGLTLNEIA